MGETNDREYINGQLSSIHKRYVEAIMDEKGPGHPLPIYPRG